MNKKKNVYILLGILLISIIFFIGMMAIQINSDKITKNVYINELNIGGLSKEEAEKELINKYKVDNISFNYKEKEWNINSESIGFEYKINETVEDAYNINKNGSFYENMMKTIKSTFGEKYNLEITTEYNKEKLKSEIEKIAKELNVEVKDANLSISGSSINVSKDIAGLKVDTSKSLEEFENKIKKGDFKLELVVDEVKPKIKKEDLQEVDTLLGSYTTKFDSSVSGRSTNIRLAAERTSNVLLMPGDKFSYNTHTKERNAANGYKNAPVIVQGVVQEGIGGGVCQVSSTLYNAVLYSGLELVNVKNHSIPSSYVIKGRDAVVANGSIDFVFRNDLKYPVYTKNYVSGNTVTCQIYGSSKDKQKIEIDTSTDGVSPAPTKKVDDPTIPKGEEKVLEKGRDAYTVSTYRVYKDNNGSVIKKVKVATSYYPKKQGVIAVGTMEAPPVEPPVEPEVPPTPPVQPPTPPVEPPVAPEEPPAPPVVPEEPVDPQGIPAT